VSDQARSFEERALPEQIKRASIGEYVYWDGQANDVITVPAAGPLTWTSAKKIMAAHGGEWLPVTAWTDTFIIITVEYDSTLWAEVVDRSPSERSITYGK
jgi:hypothetical protein